MWARSFEMALAVWLLMSCFVFEPTSVENPLFYPFMITATLIFAVAFAAYHPKSGKLHLLQAFFGCYLIGLAVLHETTPPPPNYQNAAVVGLFLLMFAIIPNRNTEPPKKWRELFRDIEETISS